MISVTLSQLVNILHGKIFGDDVTCNSIAIDTNKIKPGCLFVALKGKRFDAHNFAVLAKTAGAGALLVDHKLNIDIPQLIVKNTKLALGNLALWIRQQVPTRVVALTGSAGKTSVKEIATSILKQCGNTLSTKGNMNNDIGVPMTLISLTKKHKYAIIELGASHQGEIAWTVGLVRPEVALINNLSESHLDGFGSMKNLSKAKGEIYTGLSDYGIAIFNADSNDWLNWNTIIHTKKNWNFSLHKRNSDFTATNISLASNGTQFILNTPFGNIKISSPLLGYHNIANILAASALAMAVGASLKEVKFGLANLKAIPQRLFPIAISKNQILLDDSYNANVGSMIAAIQVLSKMPGYRVMVAGDMAELGVKSEEYHIQIGYIAKNFCIDRILTIGQLSKKLSQVSGIGEHFISNKELIVHLRDLLKKHPVITILVKGSRISSMEEIVFALRKNKIC